MLTFSDTNVALDEPYRYSCGGQKPGSIATDGITVGQGHVLKDDCGPGRGWIHLRLKYPAVVHEVKVWLGDCEECNESSSIDVFDYFGVILSGPGLDSYNFSHNYPNKATAGQPMRLVLPIEHLQKAVTVKVQTYQPLNGKTVNITEIEVIEFDKHARIFYGCYNKLGVISSTGVRAPIDDCRWECAAMKYFYFYFSIPAKCTCFTNVPQGYSPKENCITPCDTHPSGLCRNESQGHHAVYTAHPSAPEYIGCFNRYSLHDIETADTMTPKACLDRCMGKSLLYSVLFDGDSCYCARDMIGQFKLTAIRCTSPCAGDDSLICGGSGAYTVYKGCWMPYPGCPCESTAACQKLNEIGVCLDECKEGWIGDRCSRHVLPETSAEYAGINFTTKKKTKAIPTRAPPPNVALTVMALLGLGLIIGLFMGVVVTSIPRSS